MCPHGWDVPGWARAELGAEGSSRVPLVALSHQRSQEAAQGWGLLGAAEKVVSQRGGHCQAPCAAPTAPFTPQRSWIPSVTPASVTQHQQTPELLPVSYSTS